MKEGIIYKDGFRPMVNSGRRIKTPGRYIRTTRPGYAVRKGWLHFMLVRWNPLARANVRYLKQLPS